jgi:hypothetical protein
VGWLWVRLGKKNVLQFVSAYAASLQLFLFCEALAFYLFSVGLCSSVGLVGLHITNGLP